MTFGGLAQAKVVGMINRLYSIPCKVEKLYTYKNSDATSPCNLVCLTPCSFISDLKRGCIDLLAALVLHNDLDGCLCHH
jgi:hypothetical protein